MVFKLIGSSGNLVVYVLKAVPSVSTQEIFYIFCFGKTDKSMTWQCILYQTCLHKMNRGVNQLVAKMHVPE